MGRAVLQKIGNGAAVALLVASGLSLRVGEGAAEPNPTMGKVFKKDAARRSISIETDQLRVEDIFVTARTEIRGGGRKNLGFDEIPVGADVEVSWKEDFSGRKVAEWIRIRF